MNRKKDGFIGMGRLWTLVWGLGLAGQLCWNIENQWFNTFVYAKIAKSSDIVTLMVITSALATTFATFFFGTLSDRKGTRRRYIAIGYILWGLFTIAFGMTEFIEKGAVGMGAKFAVLIAVLVILADDVMSFFGSMGNDSGFNAWINDITTDRNRGQLGAALATQPVIGTIVGTVLGGMLIGGNDNYQRLFWAMGLFVIAMGVLSLFFMKDTPELKPNRQGGFWLQFSNVFRFKGFFSHKELVLVCITTTLFFIPFNVYFVHMGNWMIYHLGFTPDKMGLIEGVGLIAAMALAIPAIFLINRNRTPLVAAAAMIIDMIGLWLIYLFVRPETVDPVNIFVARNLVLILGIFLAGSGFVLIAQSMTMWVKQLYPEESRGQFEGIRVAFFTLIPMIFGTVIGNIVIKTGAGTFINGYGITENIPTEAIFFWAAILLVLAFIPLGFAARQYRQRVKEDAAARGGKHGTGNHAETAVT